MKLLKNIGFVIDLQTDLDKIKLFFLDI